MPKGKHKKQKQRSSRDRERNKQLVSSGPPHGTQQRQPSRRRACREVVFFILAPVRVRPCPVCRVKASYQVLPKLRRELLQSAVEVEKYNFRNDSPALLDIGVTTVVAALLSAFISQIYGLSTTVFVGFCVLAAVLVLLCEGCIRISTPIAVRIFGRARLADMEKTWSVFSSGRSAMNEVRFGRASTLYSPPSATSTRPSLDRSVRLGETLSDILIHVYAEQEEIDSLNLRLNDVICGATMADVIAASIQSQQRRGGSDGDLLRDFAAVCRLMENGDF